MTDIPVFESPLDLPRAKAAVKNASPTLLDGGARSLRLAQLQSRIQEGSYRVSSEDIAARLMEQLVVPERPEALKGK